MYAASPMRYPGAKRHLEKFVSAILKDNALEGGIMQNHTLEEQVWLCLYFSKAMSTKFI